jgi:hypothetical protein
MSELKFAIASTTRPHQGNLLNSVVRRDIADLNRLFLAHALDPAHRGDCWFQLPAPTLQQFERAPPDALERAACAPVALFELILPGNEGTGPWQTGAVGDSETRPDHPSLAAARRSFGLVALGVLRRLAEGVPYALRIAFGLASTCESRLSALSPSESFQLAAWDGLVRPRWARHAHYWSMLAGAATSAAKDDLFWAYSAGLCMLGQCEREPATVRYGAVRRPRPTHRRGSSGGPDVPC